MTLTNNKDTEAAFMRRDKSFSQPAPQSWYDARPRPSGWELVNLKGKRVLDIGCASGWIGWLAQKDGADVIASDIFETNCHPGLKFQVEDKEHLSFPESSFDVVLTTNTLHHGNLLKTCLEIHRILKCPGDFITFQEPCLPDGSDEYAILKKHCGDALAKGLDEHRPAWSEYVWATKMFSKVGFYEVPHDCLGVNGPVEHKLNPVCSWTPSLLIHASK